VSFSHRAWPSKSPIVRNSSKSYSFGGSFRFPFSRSSGSSAGKALTFSFFANRLRPPRVTWRLCVRFLSRAMKRQITCVTPNHARQCLIPHPSASRIPRPTSQKRMSSKYCSCCLQTRAYFFSFLFDLSNPASKRLKTNELVMPVCSDPCIIMRPTMHNHVVQQR